MHEEYEKQIQSYIPKIKEKVNILHFSTGADSVACYLRLKEWGIEPILIYDYYLPHIPMVDNYIDYFEKKFNVHIYRLPSEFCVRWIDNALFQLPVKAREDFRNATTELGFYKITNNSNRKSILKALGLKKEQVVFHKGIKYDDGCWRRITIMKNGVYSEANHTFFPIASFQVSDIISILEKYDCKLPIEYNWLGVSFEWLESRNINFMIRDCPASYEYIKRYFPLVDVLKYRNYTDVNLKTGHKRVRLANLQKFAIDKDLYKVW